MAGATTPASLLQELCAGLTPDRAEALRYAHGLVAGSIPPGYAEVVSGRMIAWIVPLSTFPKTYNKQPLMAVALAATKGNNALHLPALYMDAPSSAAFHQAYAAAGVKLDMGKGCVRFKRRAGLVDEAIRDAISLDVVGFIALYSAARCGAVSSA